MTTTNVYQGMEGGKSSSRVLQAPGGGSSHIFGHYEEETDRTTAVKRQQETNAVIQSNIRGGASNGEVGPAFNDNRDSFNANRLRNQGDGAPFAVSDSLVSTGRVDRAPQQQQEMRPVDVMSPKQALAANRSRNQGQGAPFATGDSEQQSAPAERMYHPGQTADDTYLTPQQRQSSNPNKAANSFSNLFGDQESDATHAKSQGKASKYNPITWSAKQRSMGLNPAVMSPNGDGMPPAGYMRADDEEEASHLRLCGAATVAQFNPVTWSAKAGARTDPSELVSLATRPAGIMKTSVLADESIKPLSPHAKATTPVPSYLSPNYCLAVKPNPITGYSLFIPPTQSHPSLHPGYQPDLGILPRIPPTQHHTRSPSYQPHDSIIPTATDTECVPTRKPTYVPAESIIPLSLAMATPDKLERNPVTGEGVPSVNSSAIKCYSTGESACRNPLTVTNSTPPRITHRSFSTPHLAFNPSTSDSNSCFADLSLDNNDNPLRSKGQGVFSQHKASTHNPVTWEAYSNFDADRDQPQHRSRFENYATTKAGTFNPITGEEHVGNHTSTKVINPPGGKTSIQF